MKPIFDTCKLARRQHSDWIYDFGIFVTFAVLFFQGSDSDDVIEHSPNNHEVTFFSFKPKTSLVGKKKVQTTKVE